MFIDSCEGPPYETREVRNIDPQRLQEALTGLVRAISYGYEASEYPDDLTDDVKRLLTPDGGLFMSVNLLKDILELALLNENIAKEWIFAKFWEAFELK